ncbi:MAG: hypothetical protein IJ903_08010 [Ruminococcus sp.]|nr:hypothetical protein [Ruminococcus sp.]
MRITKDFKAFTKYGGVGKKITTIFLNPNFHSVCLYRLSNQLHRIHLGFLGKIIWYINRLIFHVDIDHRADLAGGFVLVHGLGTVIGRYVVSEGPLTVYQHVTLGGGNGRPARIDENGKEWPMPLFKGNNKVYAGAFVIGGIVIGENTMIKAGHTVTRDVPPDSKV